MTITPHLLAGSALAAATTDNLGVAFLIGFLLHFVIDAIPHLDPGTFFNIEENRDKSWPTWIYIFAVSEFIIIWVVVIFLFQNKANFGIIMAGGIGGIAVDIFDNNPLKFSQKWPILKQIHFLHKIVHYDLPREKWYWGLPGTVLIIGVSLWYLLKF